HGINTSRQKPKSVTYVSGTNRHLCLGPLRTSELVIERDLASGLFGMSLGVGYPASIVAQMLARREIATPGLLNPLLHVPDGRFLDELARRGIKVAETVSWD
ncbi:saccharopine dehydrogenase C-terminal domain-containing protein, partial [Mesorhizobium sp. M0208]|uniref:saccharopine dehydrogenase C-terminal domain-containing protein n=1 Tax=Mesorhizobium sp. M0208 TaxID=2956916 RepID=UPI003334B01D